MRRAAELSRSPGERASRELPARVVVFLRAVGEHAPIRFAMRAGGYGPEDHAEGLRLLAGVCAYGEGGLDPADDEPARAAHAALEGWVRAHAARLRAALERLHPADADLLTCVESPEGGRALLGIGVFLDRLDALEERDRDAPVLQTLGVRGLDGPERKRLRELLEVARRVEAPPRPANDEGREADLIALHRWFSDWSATARAFVTRKDWLIRMGLAERSRVKLGQ